MPYIRRYRYGTRAAGRQKYSVFRKQGLSAVLTVQQNQQGWSAGQLPAVNGVAVENDCWRASSTLLIENLASGNTYVPPVLRISHLSCNISFEALPVAAIPNIVNMRFYLVYLPEGYNPYFTWPAVANSPTTYNVLGTLTDHPEWILAERTLSPLTNGGTTVTLSSRLKRNLNSGDKISLITVVNYARGYGLFNINDLKMIMNWKYAARTN